MSRHYWVPVPSFDLDEALPGKLIVIEGTDGVGRTTHVQLLRKWLEGSGLAVYDTGLSRGTLAGRHIQQAKDGHTMGRRTQCLYYATDFADRLEMEIIPALRAGYVVLTDRYIYTLMARSAVRGMERDWLRKLYGFALRPDLIIYLKVSLENLLPRVLEGGGFDHWESGMDYSGSDNLYESFIQHQNALLAELDRMADEYDFVVVDANRGIKAGFSEVRRRVEDLVSDMAPLEDLPAGVHVPISLVREERHEDRVSMGERLRDLLANLFEEGDV